MTAYILALFTAPGNLTGLQHMFMLGPLCMGISIVYKTLKCERLREVPLASLVLCVTIIVTMYAVGVGIWLLFRILA